MEVQWVDPRTLTPHPRNYREHPDDQLDHIAKSIEENGIYRPIVLAEGDVILAGHGVTKAAVRAGLESVPVYRTGFDPESAVALKLLAGDNEISNLADIQDRKLTEILKEIREESEVGLLGTGFDDAMLANLVMVTRHSNEIADFDAAAEWVGMPEYGVEPVDIRLVVHFRNEMDRARLIEILEVEHLHRQGIGNSKTVTCWWPDRVPEDLTSVGYDVPDAGAGMSPVGPDEDGE